jgi:biotin carboxylase
MSSVPLEGPDERPLLLIVATGMKTYREYLLRSIGTQFRVHLLVTVEPSWERAYVSGWTVLPNTMDVPTLVDAALALHEHDPVSGVLCWDDPRIHAASHVAEALGVRGGDPAVIWRCRDKAATRAALAAAGVAQPASIAVKTVDDALTAADALGYPVVLKPRALGASLGVVRVHDPGELRASFAFTRDAQGPEPVLFDTDQPILVEECVFGEEISVDSVVQDGKVVPLFIGRKVVGYPPYAEEVGHFVADGDPLLSDPALLDILRETHSALGFADGWTHSEYMLTTSGPKVIEVNGRLGGDMIPYLGLRATGIDPGLTAAAAACGLTADLVPSLHKVSGIRFFYVDQDDSTIVSIGFDEAMLPQAIERAITVVQPGAVVSPPPRGTAWSRIALAIAVDDSIEACRQALDGAESALRVEVNVA